MLPFVQSDRHLAGLKDLQAVIERARKEKKT
jgi:hypothetical protein